MAKIRKQKAVGNLPSKDTLLSYLLSPLAHCRHVLEEMRYSSARMSTLARKCSDVKFESRYYSRKGYWKNGKVHSLAEQQLVIVEHIYSQVAEYRRAVKTGDGENIIRVLRELTLAQGGLFGLNERLHRSTRGAQEAVKAKAVVENEIWNEASRIAKEYYARESRWLDSKQLFFDVMRAQEVNNKSVRRRSWFYALLKKRPIS